MLPRLLNYTYYKFLEKKPNFNIYCLLFRFGFERMSSVGDGPPRVFTSTLAVPTHRTVVVVEGSQATEAGFHVRSHLLDRTTLVQERAKQRGGCGQEGELYNCTNSGGLIALVNTLYSMCLYRRKSR